MRPILTQKALLFATCLALGAPWSLAQEVDGDQSVGEYLTVDVLVNWVLEENPGLAAVEAAAEAAAYRIDPAGSFDDPMLNYGAAVRSSDQNIDFSQRIPWPGTLSAREAVAQNEAEAFGWDIGTQRLRLTRAAKSAYAEWYFAARGLEIHHAVQALVEELIVTAETRYAAGRALKQDVLQAEVERAQLETQELRLLREQTAALAHLNALLNRAPETPLPPAAPISVDPLQPDLEALVSLALHRHPELNGLDAQVAAATSRITVAQKAFYPDFQIRAGYNGLWDDADKRPLLGVSINIPFDRSKREAELDRARAEMRRAEGTLADRRAQLLASLASARAEVAETLETIQVYEAQLLPLSEEYLEAAIADYQSGTGAFLNVVTAEQGTLSTELALERARADYLRRLSELEFWIGGELDAEINGPLGERQ